MGLFLKLTILIALAIIALVLIGFLIKAVFVAAVVAALVIGGLFALNFVRRLSARGSGPIVPR